MDRFETMRAFVAVAQEGNFTKAAERLDMSSQLVSKYVSQLEEHLNVRLFNRTTRKVHLTEAGESCLQHAKHILEGLSDMEGHVGQLRNEAQGRLQVAAPVSFSTLHLAPLLNDFQRQHSAVSIDLHLNDRKVDVIDEGFDVALRIGHLKSSSLIAKRIAPIRLVVCAAPDYLDKHGTPTQPDELIPQHHLRYSYMDFGGADEPLMKALRRNNDKRDNNLTCNNGEVLSKAAVAGEGYILQPTFIVSDDIKQGKLRIILEAYEPEPMVLYAVYPHRKLLATKLRAFIDMLSGYFGDPPYWDKF